MFNYNEEIVGLQSVFDCFLPVISERNFRKWNLGGFTGLAMIVLT